MNIQDDILIKPGSDEKDWLLLARRAYESSTDYLNINLRKQIEKNIHNFKSKHYPGSKYSKSSYAYRSKLFRPKTRTTVRKNEAAWVMAGFSTKDVVCIEPEDDSNVMQKIAAEVMQELVNYRLTKTIKWFSTSIGAFQEAQVVGIVASEQTWDYEEKKVSEEQNIIDELTGLPVFDQETLKIATEQTTKVKVVKDKPVINLIPFENLRIDPSSDWRDPVNTSPYLIHLMPMYLHEIKERMNQLDSKTGEPKWIKYEDAIILTAGRGDNFSDSIRVAREGNKQDPHEDKMDGLSDYTILWVHRNFIKKDGEDYVYYTLSTNKMLSKPKKIEEVYLHGIRPYVIGCCVIEAHKVFSGGTVELSEGLQEAANEIVNQRIDNVKLAMNMRYFLRRNGDIDVEALKRNIPGSGVYMRDPHQDIVVHKVPDVTRSSYEEQDRLNSDFDEIAGNFDIGTVQTNRAMNETVGGLNLIHESANINTEYLIKTFVETWVKPVLDQIVKLEQAYESDEIMIALAERKANIYKKYQIDPDLNELFKQNLVVNVSVGFGATNPRQKIEKLMFGIQALAQFGPQVMSQIKHAEVVKEVFGALGYSEARFFKDLEAIEQQPQTPPVDPIKMQELQLKAQELQLKREIEGAKLKAQIQIEMMKLALEKELTMNQLYKSLDLDKKSFNLNVLKELGKREDLKVKREEMRLKRETGQGI